MNNMKGFCRLPIADWMEEAIGVAERRLDFGQIISTPIADRP
jgi:hypothetical protein